MRLSHDTENYQGLGLCYLPQPSASADNTNLCLDNSQYHAQPHPITANSQLVTKTKIFCYISYPCTLTVKESTRKF